MENWAWMVLVMGMNIFLIPKESLTAELSFPQILPPRIPVIFWPAFADALEIRIGYIDMDQFNPSGTPLRPEGKDQYGVKVLRLPTLSPPGLNDETLRDGIKHSSGKHAVEGAKFRSGLGANGYRTPGKSSMGLGVQVHVIEAFCGGGQCYALLDHLGHGSFPLCERLI